MVDQLTQADVKRLYAEGKWEAVEAARESGALAVLLGQVPPSPTDRQWTQSDLDTAYAERRWDAICDARDAGHLDNILAGTADDAA